jgi:hypothetical protein
VAFFQMEGATVASRPAVKSAVKPAVRAAALPVTKRAVKRSAAVLVAPLKTASAGEAGWSTF